MTYIKAFIVCIFIVMALLHVSQPMPLCGIYLGTTVLALITLKREISDMFSRPLAVITTLAMFFFFAEFFVVAPRLSEGWYLYQEGWRAACLLLGTFAMIPILSDYSCRLKAECVEAGAHPRWAFFSVPSHIQPRR